MEADWKTDEILYSIATLSSIRVTMNEWWCQTNQNKSYQIPVPKRSSQKSKKLFNFSCWQIYCSNYINICPSVQVMTIDRQWLGLLALYATYLADRKATLQPQQSCLSHPTVVWWSGYPQLPSYSLYGLLNSHSIFKQMTNGGGEGFIHLIGEYRSRSMSAFTFTASCNKLWNSREFLGQSFCLI